MSTKPASMENISFSAFCLLQRIVVAPTFTTLYAAFAPPSRTEVTRRPDNTHYTTILNNPVAPDKELGVKVRRRRDDFKRIEAV